MYIDFPLKYQMHIESITEGKSIVYKYVNMWENSVYYVGMTSNFVNRHISHLHERWHKDSSHNMLCCFFCCRNTNEADVYETYYINKYKNKQLRNVSKVGKDISNYFVEPVIWRALIPNVNDLMYDVESYIDYCTSRNKKTKVSFEEATHSAYSRMIDIYNQYRFIQLASSYANVNFIPRA